MSRTYRVAIPDIYLWMVEDIQDRHKKGRTFKRYVSSYLAIAHPDMKLIKIDGMKAVCKKKEV
ncbi:hypothetical protein P4631_07780 [Halalkalibacterium halodurans]|uniref:hypothetical protein n=1 Tax=Halalkalibacterium halodurans TaxID=86665 RepID=UPI002E244741|nr:hypothetical protein [Halalkalibacterium halodurans]